MKLLKKEIIEVFNYDLFDDNKVTIEIEIKNNKIIKSIVQSKFSPDLNNKNKCMPVFVKDLFFELIKTQNPWALQKAWSDPKFIYTNNEVAEMVISGNFNIEKKNLVLAYHHGHILFDYNEEPIPTVFHYDYIASPFSNKYCDLEEMLKHLKKHPWVVNHDELVIDFVPWYNNESGNEKWIKGKESQVIKILPEREAYLEIYKRAKESDEEFFSVRMKELIVSGSIYNWGTTNEKDWLQIKKFFKRS